MSVVTSTRWFASSRARTLRYEIIDLSFGGTDDHLRIDESGRPYDLLNDLGRFVDLPGARRRREQDRLACLVMPLLEGQGPVIHRRWETESVLDEHVLSRPVTCELAVDLRDGDVALVDDGQVVIREVVEQRVGRLACLPAVEIA